jgi:PAS domain S-box-containing protein
MASAARPPPTPAPGLRMWRHLAQFQLLWLAALYIMVSAAGLALALVTLRVQAIESSQRSLAALTRVIEEQTSRTLQTVDLRLQLAADEIQHLASTGRLDRESAGAALERHLQGLPFTTSMWLLDARGMLVGTTADQGIGSDASTRDYFLGLRARADTGLAIGKPAAATEGADRRHIPVARALRATDRRFMGVVAVGIDPVQVEKSWSSIDLGEDFVISLYHRDATLMVRSPLNPADLGRSFPQMAVFNPPYAGAQEGQFRTLSLLDGHDRYYAFRALALQPDLLLVAGQSSAVILAPWWRATALALVLWLLASSAIAALGISMHRARQRQAENDRRARDFGERLDLATSAAGIGAWDWDLTRHSGNASPGFFTMLGYEPTSLAIDRSSWIERCHQDDLALAEASLRHTLTGQSDGCEIDLRLRHADGGYRWVRLVGRVNARDEQGRALRMVGVRMDIHERRLAEDALRKSEAFNTTVLDSVNAHIAVLDRDGVILAVNQPWRRFALENSPALAGAGVPSLVGTNYLDACRHSLPAPRDEQALAARACDGILAVMLRRSPHFTLEYPCHAPDAQRWFQMQCTPLGGADGGVVISHDDITQRVVAEERLRQTLRLYALRVQISRAIIEHRDRLRLLQEICRVAIAFGGFRMAWIGIADPDSGRIQALAHEGHDQGFLDQLQEPPHAGIALARLPQPLHATDVVTVTDIAAEPLYPAWKQAALQRGYRSSAVVAFTQDEKPLGSLYLFAAEPGFFTPDERQMLRQIGQDISFALAAITSETARENAERALHGLLQDKEALLREVHHRVKNNLQVVSSLLRLEAARDGAASTVSVLRDMQGRIQAMGLLHETLYGSGNFARVDLAVYLRQLATQAFTTFSSGSGGIHLRLDLTSIEVSMDQAITCGLLVNELVSNGLKHGFPQGRTGEVCIELLAGAGAGELLLRISDTGIGLPDDFTERQSRSLGMQLVDDLAAQLGGTLCVGPRPRAVFTVGFTVLAQA